MRENEFLKNTIMKTFKSFVQNWVIYRYGRCRYKYINQDDNSYTVKVYNRYHDKEPHVYIFKVYIKPLPHPSIDRCWILDEEIDKYLED